MDSLKIQDVFEPYYAGRKRFAARRDKSQPVEAQNDPDSAEVRHWLLRRLLAEPRTIIETETDSTTEH
ncbi:hypothetical protein D3227_24350 [Mesorhizobium waimense]|uniref:Uncharacterized protein n=1 Tax=Mesorhizobium waimense TaxID=1300307 RepID=A0A3A5KSH1_9HYPH|nr:hypothetical protein [Mesorhizobium waimense]RJT34124.1 hypothetical protein D3227_24350 [Mesorhizobium waimense]